MDEPLSRWRYLFREPAGKQQIGGKFRSKWGYLEMSPGYNYQNMTDGFINTQVVSRGLDERTAKAYRLDLEKFYRWLESGEEGGHDLSRTGGQPDEGERAEPATDKNELARNRKNMNVDSVSEKMEDYLNYLSREKGLRYSTVCRKQRVLGYYLSYLASQGILDQYQPLKPVAQVREEAADMLLTKKEVELLFGAIEREYEGLDSDFRRRVCLRDQVMMKLLFYHGIEVSELLRLEVMDYNWKTAFLAIRGKRGKSRSVYLFSKELRGQMEHWLSEHGYFEHDDLYRNRMFLSKMGKPLSMKMVINIFDKYRMLAGIEKECKPKDLKNSLGRYAEELVWEMG